MLKHLTCSLGIVISSTIAVMPSSAIAMPMVAAEQEIWCSYYHPEAQSYEELVMLCDGDKPPEGWRKKPGVSPPPPGVDTCIGSRIKCDVKHED